MLFKNSVRTSKRTPHFTITKIKWLMLFKEQITVYSDNHRKLINTLRAKCRVRLLNQAVYSYHCALEFAQINIINVSTRLREEAYILKPATRLTYQWRHHAGEEIFARVGIRPGAEFCEDGATHSHGLLVSVRLQEALRKRHLETDANLAAQMYLLPSGFINGNLTVISDKYVKGNLSCGRVFRPRRSRL
jgi:hypothetical protein